MRRRSRFVGNGEENAAAEGSFQSKPPEYTAVAKPFPKEICEPARRKILDQAKFLSKGRFIGYWGKAPKVLSIRQNHNLLFPSPNQQKTYKNKGQTFRSAPIITYLFLFANFFAVFRTIEALDVEFFDFRN